MTCWKNCHTVLYSDAYYFREKRCFQKKVERQRSLKDKFKTL